MSTDLIQAGNRLAGALEAENAALSALDLPGAAALLADKQRAVAELAAASPLAVPNPAGERIARRLQALAQENKRLLERAIAVQGRVIGVVAHAAVRDVSPASYGRLRGQRPAAFALSAKA